MDVLLDFDTSGFDFSNLENMVEITETSAPVHAGEKKKRDKLAARACVLCNQAHTACDNARPCLDVFQKELHTCAEILNPEREEGLPSYLNNMTWTWQDRHKRDRFQMETINFSSLKLNLLHLLQM